MSENRHKRLQPTTNVFLPAIDFPIGVFEAEQGRRSPISSVEIVTNMCIRLQIFFYRLLIFQSVFLMLGGAGGPGFSQQKSIQTLAPDYKCFSTGFTFSIPYF